MAGSDEQFSNLSSSIQQTAISLGTSVERVSEAVKTYANETESASSIIAKTKADIELSNVSGGELSAKEATDAIHGIINQYNLVGQNAETTATHVSDSLISISKNLALDFGQGVKDMSAGIEVVGSVAHDVGKQTSDETTSMIGAIEEKTRISGSQIANGLFI